MKFKIQLLTATILTALSWVTTVHAAPAVCQNEVHKFCEGRNDQACDDRLNQMANRLTREYIVEFDGTACKEALRNERPHHPRVSVCDRVQSTVIQALGNCWNQYDRGCVQAVVQRYSEQLISAGRSERQCRAKIEWACRAECYPRFPDGCNKSCASLAAYVP